MITVWIVYDDYNEDQTVVGLYESKELAELAIAWILKHEPDKYWQLHIGPYPVTLNAVITR